MPRHAPNTCNKHWLRIPISPAHWQLGEMKIDGQWMPVDSDSATSKMGAKFNEYRQAARKRGP